MPALAPTSTPEGEWFRSIRMARGLSQEQFAELLGVEQPTISKTETGRRTISPRLGLRLITRANVPVGDVERYVDMCGYLVSAAA